MPDWIVKYWVEWAFGILIAIFTAVGKHLHTKIKQEIAAREELAKQAAEETEALKSGMRSLLRRQIIEDCKKAMTDGYCEEPMRDTITAMYEAYHALGGNGTVTHIIDALEELPFIPIPKP